MISGKEAKLAWANGEELQWRDDQFTDWSDLSDEFKLRIFSEAEFRLKTRTIAINGIEVPAPFEPKQKEKYWYISTKPGGSFGYDWACSCHNENDSIFKQFGAWQTEDEIKQVVAALRSVFNDH